MEKTGRELFQFLVGTWITTNEYGKSSIRLAEDGTFETSMTTDNAAVSVAKAITDLMGMTFRGQWSVSGDLVVVSLDPSAGLLTPFLALRKAFYGNDSKQLVRIIGTTKVTLKNLESGEEYTYCRA